MKPRSGYTINEYCNVINLEHVPFVVTSPLTSLLGFSD